MFRGRRPGYSNGPTDSKPTVPRFDDPAQTDKGVPELASGHLCAMIAAMEIDSYWHPDNCGSPGLPLRMKEAPVYSQDRGSIERRWTPGTRRIEVLMPLVGRACWGTDNVPPGIRRKNARRTG